MQYIYGAVYCEGCDQIHYYRAIIERGFVDHEHFRCPGCCKELKKIRADWGYEVLGSKPGDQGEFSCQLGDADINDVDELIREVEDLFSR